MSGKFWGIKVKKQDIDNGYFPAWRSVCEPLTWTCDASHFSGSMIGAWAILAPSGRLVTGIERRSAGAPEFRGLIEAIRLVPEGTVGATVETDQLSIASIMDGGDNTHAVRLSHTAPLWTEMLELLATRDVTLRWVRGHGRRSNPRMAVVDEASRKAARMTQEGEPWTWNH